MAGASGWGRWLGPVGAVLLTGGSVAAVALLLRRAGRSRDAFGTVEQVAHHADMQVLAVTLQLKSRWPGHRAGQFAFVRFDGDREPHPFTLSSAWRGDGRLLLHVLLDARDGLPAAAFHQELFQLR